MLDTSNLIELTNGWYKSEHGYYIKDTSWKFLPDEIEFEYDELLNIAETIKALCERDDISL